MSLQFFKVVLLFRILYFTYCNDVFVDIQDEGGVKHIYNIKVSDKDSKLSAKPNAEISQIIDNILKDKSQSTDKKIQKLKEFAKFDNSDSTVKNGYTEDSNDSLFYTNSILNLQLSQKHKFLTTYDNILQTIVQSLWIPSEVSSECYDKATKLKLPYGLCDEKLPNPLPYNEKSFQNYASFIVDGSKLPHATGRKALNYKMAHAIVLLNTGHAETSIKELAHLIKHHPSLPVLFYLRSVAYLRKDPVNLAKKALEDVDRALKLETMESQPYERKAGILALLGLYKESMPFADKAIAFNPNSRNYQMRALLNYFLQSLSKAEKDLRKVLSLQENNLPVMYHLGIVLIQRGRYRSAAAIFNDILQSDPSHFDSLIILAEIYKAIGDTSKAFDYFGKAMSHNPSSKILIEIYKSRAELHYSTGDLKKAIKDSEECIQLDSKNYCCSYLRSLSLSALGQFYEGIKSAIKVIVLESFQSNRLLSLNPEYIKAQYLKEWDRYIHSHLEEDISRVNISRDFSPDYRDKWMKNIPLDFVPGYQEQMGLQPHIPDVTESIYSDYSKEVQSLLCDVKKRSRLFSTEVDGSHNNLRVNFALSLGSMYVAQSIREYWSQTTNRSFSSNRESVSPPGKLTWRSLFDVIVRYVSLADPQHPLLWIEELPAEHTQDGYTSEKVIIKGEEENYQLMPYFNLVFQLVKTMVEYMKQDMSETKVDVTLNGNKATVASAGSNKNSATVLQEIRSASDCSQLLKAAKKKGATSTSGGVFVSTQVPSIRKRKSLQLEGEIIFLSEDLNHHPILGLNVLLTTDRMKAYNEEMSFIFDSFLNEALHFHKRFHHNASGLTEEELGPLLERSLSFLYYVSNARPISHSSSLVGYSFTIGMLMALGFDIQGKIPPTKMLDIEPLLAGTPDAFIIVAKNWLKIKISTEKSPLNPSVRQHFSSVRNIIEILALSANLVCA